MARLQTLEELARKYQNEPNPGQAAGTTGAPGEEDSPTIIPITEPIVAPTIPTGNRQQEALITPNQPLREVNPHEPPNAPPRRQEPNPGTATPALEGIVPQLPPSEFVAMNFESLNALLREEARKRSN